MKGGKRCSNDTKGALRFVHGPRTIVDALYSSP